jgi:hypothetical protein
LRFTPEKRPYLVAAAILLLGMGIAVVLYVTADAPSSSLPWEITTDSKKYVRSLQVYGGNLNVMLAEFTDWFNGLWHGTNLAYTVAKLTLAGSVGYLVFAKSRRLGNR